MARTPKKHETNDTPAQQAVAVEDAPTGEGEATPAPNGEATAAAPAPEAPVPAEQAEDYRALLQRERADFINYRRRVEQERAALINQAKAEALVPLLPLLDDLERAAAEVPAELKDHSWVKGVLLIADKIGAAIRAAGLERVDALGQPFDPRHHEAFLHHPHDAIPAGHISLVMRPGYRIGDRVVRPAQVAVSQGSAGDQAAAPEES